MIPLSSGDHKKGKPLIGDNRYNRWQGLAIAQFSVAIALISGLSVAGLGAGLSLLQNEKFVLDAWTRWAFILSQLLFVIAAFFGCAAVITRVLDFRLTARITRKSQWPEYQRSLTIFGCDSKEYGRATWRLFWVSCVSLALGAVLLITSIGMGYATRLYSL
jgi:hypothetical protein